MGYHQSADQKVKRIDCLDSLQFQGLHLSKRHFTEIASSAFTADAQDNGKVFLCDTTLVITLPAIGSNEMGPYTFVNYGVETDNVSNVLITLAPNSSDKISGCDITAANDKDLINTLATARRGDYVKLVYGGSDGWSIEEMVGTWARES